MKKNKRRKKSKGQLAHYKRQAEERKSPFKQIGMNLNGNNFPRPR